MLDVLLAYAHHLAVFSLVGLIFAEFVLLTPGIAGQRLSRLGSIDAAYGGFAMLVVVAGVLRVYFGASGADYYFGNHVFWTKMGLFVAVGLLSIFPTIAFIRWRRAAKADPDFEVPDAEIIQARRFLVGEAVLLALVPLAAAMMARGIG